MWICPKCGRKFQRTNQSHYCGEAPKTIEEYIAQQDASIQEYLLQLHRTITEALPDVCQRIAWSMPTYGAKKPVLQFAACKNHVSLYVGADAIAHFQTELQGFVCKKSAVYLSYGKPLPKELVITLVRWCCS